MGDQKFSEKLMSMTDAVWLRHANPLSGWTRLASGPLIFLALWSHVWIGWRALIPIAILAVWIWLNPRVFPRPKNADAWMTKAVLGERVWLNRKAVPIPKGHARAALLTTLISGALLIPAIAGLFLKDFWMAFIAWHFSIFAKLWFLDRMVWLWGDMKTAAPEYVAWEDALTA